MAQGLSKLLSHPGVLLSTASVAGIAALASRALGRDPSGARASTLVLDRLARGSGSASSQTKSSRPGVDAVFFRRLRGLLTVLVPGPASAEAAWLFAVAVLMGVRTWCDVVMIANQVATERSIISRDRPAFLRNLAWFVSLHLPVSVVNNLLKYGLGELALRFRERLTRHLYGKYLHGFVFYRVTNLDTRIANPDQLFTKDVEKFCTGLSELYSNLAKPMLDIVIYATTLARTIGGTGPLRMMMYLVASGTFLTRLRRPVGQFTVTEQKREGQFQQVNSYLITNSEEIAFYGGNERERGVIMSTFSHLVAHLRRAMQFRYTIGIVDTIVAKYWATVVGYIVVSGPFLDLSHPRHATSSHAEIMEDYYKSGRMLVNMSMAIGRLVLAGRDLTRLAGFTATISELMETLDDLTKGNYRRTMINHAAPGAGRDGAGGEKASAGASEKASAGGNTGPIVAERKGAPAAAGKASASSPSPSDLTSRSSGAASAVPAFGPNAGKIAIRDHVIEFDRVPLVTPNGDVLVRELTFKVSSMQNCMITGPNGCGKSSLFRTLSGLWPCYGGTITKPGPGQLFYVPQRPYLMVGTLRDQIIYPHSIEDMAKAGRTGA
jgi:ATP-binding cassette subfamily D (ALD) protein 3